MVVDDAPSPLAHFTLHWTRTKVLEFVAREVLALPLLLSLSVSVSSALLLSVYKLNGSQGQAALSLLFPSLFPLS